VLVNASWPCSLPKSNTRGCDNEEKYRNGDWQGWGTPSRSNSMKTKAGHPPCVSGCIQLCLIFRNDFLIDDQFRFLFALYRSEEENLAPHEMRIRHEMPPEFAINVGHDHTRNALFSRRGTRDRVAINAAVCDRHDTSDHSRRHG
jgi:hypothetical protein